jgi:hypothetical protein
MNDIQSNKELWILDYYKNCCLISPFLINNPIIEHYPTKAQIGTPIACPDFDFSSEE